MTHQEIYNNLIKRMKEYHPSKDFSLIDKAYKIAAESHGCQVRKSGEPYIIHPMWVAYILADLELDMESVVSGILHDVLEDTTYGHDQMVADFGQEITDIVEGVTKLDNIEDSLKEDKSKDTKTGTHHVKDKQELQAENYRKMFIAMAKDIRVILIKIADRLHNMRTLQFMRPEKQKEKAQETLDIYAPLCHRLGISKLRYELEDLSFRYLHEDAYFDLQSKIQLKSADRQGYINSLVTDLKEKISKRGMNVFVEGRSKHLFSIYKKMVNQDKTLDQILDIFAVRVIVDVPIDCYEVLGLVHDMYKPMPGRFKDYIGMPKPNMYQSLHTVVIDKEGEPIEIQIRTWDMHRTAEYGIAAHWKYKEGKGGTVDASSAEAKLAWLRQILEWQRDLSDNKEYLTALKTDLDVYSDQVYCFTPKGDIIPLLRGATPIDFAYTIHTAIGNRMVGCRVNGIIVPFDYTLLSGDRVTIMTSQNSKGPSRDWLNIVKTNQARTKINQWFKKENREENIARGKDILDKEAKKKCLSLSELLTTERKNLVLNKFGFPDWNSLCAAVGHGGVKETQVINRLKEDFITEQERNNPPEIRLHKDNAPFKHSSKKSGIVVNGTDDVSVRFSKCCCPVPGDEIIGFVTKGRGVSIHRTDCINILMLDDISRHRLVETEWQLDGTNDQSNHYNAHIRITGTDRVGLLFDVSKMFSEEKVPVMDFTAQVLDGVALFTAIIIIDTKAQLDKITKKLSNLKGVKTVDRVTK